jgi:hypothetical protein
MQHTTNRVSRKCCRTSPALFPYPPSASLISPFFPTSSIAFPCFSGYFDEALSSFFRNVDSRVEPPLDLPVGDGRGRIHMLKARAVVVDMEEGVVNELLKGNLGDLFDHRQMLYDVSGSGNNWAHGYSQYGTQYR